NNAPYTNHSMKLTSIHATALAAIGLLFTATSASAADIDEVMKTTMKGDASLYKKVATGKGSDEDAAKLLAHLKDLSGKKPPKGEQAAYDEKVTKLLAAAEGVVAKNPGALQQLQTAGNCKACHSAHKGD
ncbi:MAG: hypothetical protein ACOYMN_15000, partial [Roseimicrobium sp.]